MKIIKRIGFFFLGIILIFLCLVFFPLSDISFPDKDYEHLLIENINIIDVENDSILKNHFVLISEEQIKLISAKSIKLDDLNVKVIKGKDKYLIPSLWDMHAHLSKQSTTSAYAEYVMNGVMHLREMRGGHHKNDPFASTPKRIEKWNRRVESKKLLGPKVHNIPSFAVEGPNKMYDDLPAYFNCANESDAKKLVSHFKVQGVTMIKVYNNIPREAFFTLMIEAKKNRLEVTGHKPLKISTIEAANSGMKSFEHARFLLWDSFEGAENLRNSEKPKKLDNTLLRQRMLTELDTLLLNDNLEAMRKNNTFYCPTHLTRKSDAFAEHNCFRDRYNAINPIFRFLSFEDLDATVKDDTTKLGRQVYKEFYEKGLEITKTANEKGVKLLAGSDVPELPGSSLVDELKELSKSGLSNYDVLKSATINPSEYFNKQNELGSIKEVKKADLIILSENPIESIENLEKVEGLVCNGVYIDSNKIKIIKEKIYKRNNSWAMTAKLIYDVFVFMLL